MPRSAILIAVLAFSAACSAASDDLERMQAVVATSAVDVAGTESETPVDTTVPPDDIADPDSTEGDGSDPVDDGLDDEADSGSDDPPPTSEPPPTDDGVPVIRPVVVERFPHDGNAFTQGLAYSDGVLIESLGLLGQSARRRVAPATGEVIASARLSDDLFGAGLDVTADGRIIQLTWQQGVAIVSDPTTMLELSRLAYEGEGWGVCQLDSGMLVLSNGSGLLTFRDLETFTPQGEIEVTLDGEPTTNLNELECVGQSIYANVWLESVIYDIDASTGEVRRVIDATDLVPGDLGPDDVLNGIAHRPETDTFFLTGKRWTVMYEVTLG